MKLVHLPGLNCYYDCVITLAKTFELDYIGAFSGLWAEAELRYDPICRGFLTRRMPGALKDMGMELRTPCVSEKEIKLGWGAMSTGGFAIVGMDAFLIPWNPLWGLQHGPHYFVVRKGAEPSQFCFDPTYGLSDRQLDVSKLVTDAFSLIPINNTAVSRAATDIWESLIDQAEEVLKTHPDTLQNFPKRADHWIHNAKETVLLPAKFVDAMLMNRYMYQYFLEKRRVVPEGGMLFYDRLFYEEWKAVKNGFYKAALTLRDHSAFNEACSRFASLLKQEIELAEKIFNL